MTTTYTPLDHSATIQELTEAWSVRYHYLYKLTRVLKMRPVRVAHNTMQLSIAQQQQLADVLSARVPRALELERRSSEDLHADLDRLTHSYERLAAEHEATVGL